MAGVAKEFPRKSSHDNIYLALGDIVDFDKNEGPRNNFRIASKVLTFPIGVKRRVLHRIGQPQSLHLEIYLHLLCQLVKLFLFRGHLRKDAGMKESSEGEILSVKY